MQSEKRFNQKTQGTARSRFLSSLTSHSLLGIGLLFCAALPIVGIYVARSSFQLAHASALEEAERHSLAVSAFRQVHETPPTENSPELAVIWAERLEHVNTRFLTGCPQIGEAGPPLDGFEKEALRRLSANPHIDYHQNVTVSGIMHVRFASTTVARKSCTQCHSSSASTEGVEAADEQNTVATDKRAREIILVDVPLTKAHQSHSQSLWSISALLLGMAACGIVATVLAMRSYRKQTKLAIMTSRELAFARQKAEHRALDAEHATDAALKMIKDLEEAREKAAAATDAKSTFLATMSHELRTPMTAILGFADILRSDELLRDASPASKDAVDTISRNAEHLLKLINGILDLSKIEAEKLELKYSQCSPFQVIAESTELLRVHADLKALPLQCEFPSPLPEIIESDPLRLNQILINLVGNAVKFTESGSVIVRTDICSDGDEVHLQVDVIDTGIGIPADQLESLFEPFTQVDNSYTRQFEGTGLGLTVSKRLAQLLGGDISVRSTKAGSVFSLTIPIDGQAPRIEYQEYVNRRRQVMERDRKRPDKDLLQGIRILLAEDGVDNQKLISFVLTKAGAEIEVVNDGQEAVDAIERAPDQSHYDLVLMDMHMPVLDGYSATRRLRQDGYEGPIVALTANAMRGDREKCIQAGCNDYAAKPINRRKLVALVRDVACSDATAQGNNS